MEKNDPKKGEKNGFDREDPGRNGDKPFAPFAKDKRKRIVRTEKTEPRRREDYEERSPRRNDAHRTDYNRDNEQRPPYRNDERRDKKPYQRDESPRKPYSGGNERHSYNPNFTKDNKFRGGGDRFNRTDRPERPDERNFNRYDDDRRQHPERDFNRTDYNPDDSRPPRKNYGDKPSYNREGGPGRKTYGDKPSYGRSDKPSYGRSDKPSYNRTGDTSKYGQHGKPQFGRDNKRPRTQDGRARGPGRKPKTPADGRYSDGSYPTFPAPVIENEIRLNRYIAAAGKCSRREADEMIKTGRVTVNGDTVTEMGAKVKAGDIVQVDSETIHSEKKVYILMNKPKGFVTTLEDPFAEKTVMDLLKNACTERVYPVGRLDKNSLGVLLITNDGDLTTQLTHPSYSKKKIYQVTLDRPLTKADMQAIADGITLEDGEIHADEISYVDENKKEIGIEVHSGRNRIVRRIFEHLGYKVNKLDRVYFASLTKKNLKRGQWRFLTPKEVAILKSGLYE